MKQVALFGVVATVALLMSGCTLVADDEQKKTVTDTFAALPDAVDQVLRVGEVRMHFFNDFGNDVGADRQIHLDAGPPQDTTLGPWVAGCRAMVGALAPTPARLYGRLPDGPDVYEATDELCLRGLGHPLGSAEKPALMLGLSRGDRVVDTAVNFNPDAGTIETFGYDWRPRGAVIPVRDAVPADLDAAVRAVPVPWHPADSKSIQATFLVPAGTVLQVTASCGAGWKRVGHIKYDPRADGNYLTFGGGVPSQYGPATREGMQDCTTMLRHALQPQVSYRTADGRQVDRYAFVTFVNAVDPGDAAPSIEVTGS